MREIAPVWAGKEDLPQRARQFIDFHRGIGRNRAFQSLQRPVVAVHININAGDLNLRPNVVLVFLRRRSLELADGEVEECAIAEKAAALEPQSVWRCDEVQLGLRRLQQLFNNRIPRGSLKLEFQSASGEIGVVKIRVFLDQRGIVKASLAPVAILFSQTRAPVKRRGNLLSPSVP